MDAESGLAVSTAAVNSNAVCAIFANGNLICLDQMEIRKWDVNIGTLENIYGYSSSIVIFENTLIIQHDSSEDLSILGYDIETGQKVWETARRGQPVWSSPVIASFDGKPQVVINGNPAVTAYDRLTGQNYGL
jgi:outer membrane protein assembly factor BamB